MVIKDGSTVILAILEIVHHNLSLMGWRGAPLCTWCWTALVKIPCTACDLKEEIIIYGWKRDIFQVLGREIEGVM